MIDFSLFYFSEEKELLLTLIHFGFVLVEAPKPMCRCVDSGAFDHIRMFICAWEILIIITITSETGNNNI